MKERRSSKRARVDLLFNKFIDGYPYTCHVLDLGMGGMRVRRINERDTRSKRYPLELVLPGFEDAIWIWSRPVWNQGDQQALRFVAMDANDRAHLATYLGTLRKAA
ncbi:MAG: PilZ domain-containing protein [Deltaproteobacteria bacterium]|nr:PilZ domain-containing protein [Deltaproteobacteria bacterium]